MAFDRPLEADSVDDVGFFGSLIRAPVVGIMWLLGGEHAEESEEGVKAKQEIGWTERQISEESHEHDNVGGDGEEGRCSPKGDSASSFFRERQKSAVDVDSPPDDVISLSPATSVPPGQSDDQAEVKGKDKENEVPSSLQNWPSVDFSNPPKNHHCDDDTKSRTASARPCSSGKSSRRENQSSARGCPATQVNDDLMNAMESSHISNGPPMSSGPASAVLSQSQVMTSSTDSASFSASTFSNQNTSQNLLLQTNVNNSVHHSPASTSLRGSKKMSWSDECGNRSLVEYFDDSAAAPSRSRHWSTMRQNSWMASRPSFNGGEKGSSGRTRQSGVIKSALKRSGSYSPPVSSLYTCNSRGNASSTSTYLSCASSSSSPEMRSFRSISVIGSSDTSRSGSSDHVSKASMRSQDHSIAAVTYKELNATDMQCVPSTLQIGCGRASGGLIIPRGGPGDTRYYFPRDRHNDPRYQVLGGGMPSEHKETNAASNQGEQDEAKDETNELEVEAPEKAVDSPNPGTYFTGSQSSPGHHHFLPRHHTNGYISPQYGFYVNITPPTPELYAARKSLKPGEKTPRSIMQQQSYHQFQYQNNTPFPIPECALGTPGIPHRFVGRSRVLRPSSHKHSSEIRDLSGTRKNSMKSTFTKNKKGMGMLLAENPHHGVWPTVPFG